VAEALNGEGRQSGLNEALRKARMAEAARSEAQHTLKDAKSLRLQVLKDELAPLVAESEEARRFFELVLIVGEEPRLWIDLITSVVMEPDPKSYRLVQESQGGREILFETSEREEMAATIKQHMAHRLLARERQIVAAPRLQPVIKGFSLAVLLYAWLSGFVLGVLVLLVSAILLGKLGI
jgi:hypothetical protein